MKITRKIIINIAMVFIALNCLSCIRAVTVRVSGNLNDDIQIRICDDPSCKRKSKSTPDSIKIWRLNLSDGSYVNKVWEVSANKPIEGLKYGQSDHLVSESKEAIPLSIDGIYLVKIEDFRFRGRAIGGVYWGFDMEGNVIQAETFEEVVAFKISVKSVPNEGR